VLRVAHSFDSQVRINATAATSPWLTVNSNLTLNIDDVLTLDDAGRPHLSRVCRVVFAVERVVSHSDLLPPAILITGTGWLEQNGDLDLRVRNATCTGSL
jgi:hypothetical protein